MDLSIWLDVILPLYLRHIELMAQTLIWWDAPAMAFQQLGWCSVPIWVVTSPAPSISSCTLAAKNIKKFTLTIFQNVENIRGSEKSLILVDASEILKRNRHENLDFGPSISASQGAARGLHRSPTFRCVPKTMTNSRPVSGPKARGVIKETFTHFTPYANIGQKREQAIANLSWSFKLEGDAEDRHKWILNACKCCVSTKPSSCLIQQPSFESGLEKSKTGVKTKNQAKHTKNIKTLQVGIQLVEGAEARLTSEQMRLSPRVKWVK